MMISLGVVAVAVAVVGCKKEGSFVGAKHSNCRTALYRAFHSLLATTMIWNFLHLNIEDILPCLKRKRPLRFGVIPKPIAAR
jgi:hypothetical protein